MKVNLRISIIAFLYFAALIAFETGQQHFYINRFNLPGNDEVSFWYLIKNHAVRWGIWTITAIPLTNYVLKNPLRSFNLALLKHYFFWVLSTLIFTLIAISLYQLWFDENNITDFKEYFSFFSYQKGALFVNAYIGIIVLLTLLQNLKLLDATFIELSDLKSNHEELLRQGLEDSTPLIQIRIGNNIKNVLLSNVIWIQSDDYCVRIHTQEGSYHLRKSMKAIEEELSDRGFIRIHRKYIVNRLEIDSINFSKESYVQLKNGINLIIAQNRIPKVKAYLKKEGFSA
ncbi:LytR/AlgR family response regulator transcription factor [Croceitalea rosinachiae]|uniref:LytTR family DNA-binding domain-containing protein n=1 Tax=Croceitalea rosinachiae TaxID=3075596 RepID=A0ABU3AEA5_9FLAO|nr:LytTR family DNA-binding domain-containing protein [Croceitalea sp. F388]MDT0608512.1 LytTR family DNA-binding domain-containing protein [Croceitalea sp. F388]